MLIAECKARKGPRVDIAEGRKQGMSQFIRVKSQMLFRAPLSKRDYSPYTSAINQVLLAFSWVASACQSVTFTPYAITSPAPNTRSW